MDPKLKEEIRAKVNIRVPGLKKSRGAGDVVKGATEAVGVEPCSECEKRRRWMNRLLRFQGADE